jgi:hypothetical protein
MDWILIKNININTTENNKNNILNVNIEIEETNIGFDNDENMEKDNILNSYYFKDINIFHLLYENEVDKSLESFNYNKNEIFKQFTLDLPREKFIINDIIVNNKNLAFEYLSEFTDLKIRHTIILFCNQTIVASALLFYIKYKIFNIEKWEELYIFKEIGDVLKIRVNFNGCIFASKILGIMNLDFEIVYKIHFNVHIDVINKQYIIIWKEFN